MPCICLRIRTAKPGRANFQALLQKVGAPTAFMAYMSTLYKMPPEHQGNSNDTKCLCFCLGNTESSSTLVLKHTGVGASDGDNLSMCCKVEVWGRV